MVETPRKGLSLLLKGSSEQDKQRTGQERNVIRRRKSGNQADDKEESGEAERHNARCQHHPAMAAPTAGQSCAKKQDVSAKSGCRKNRVI